MMIEIRLSINPVLTICNIVISPVPNTIALGGVATGSMNAQLAAIVAGIANKYGCTPTAGAIAASTGTSDIVVATLEVSSVMKTMAVVISVIVMIGGALRSCPA
jgi:hypothetical protein